MLAADYFSDRCTEVLEEEVRKFGRESQQGQTRTEAIRSNVYSLLPLPNSIICAIGSSLSQVMRKGANNLENQLDAEIEKIICPKAPNAHSLPALSACTFTQHISTSSIQKHGSPTRDPR